MGSVAKSVISVLVVSADGVVFEGPATSLIVPGEQGTFEILPLHRPLVSRLLSGTMAIDGRSVSIRRGAIRVADDIVTAIVELR